MPKASSPYPSKQAVMRMTEGVRVAGLYKTEGEIAVLVLGGNAIRWPDIAAVLEREGLPRIDAITGMRFWPAVESFLLNRHGVITSRVPGREDGAEIW